MTTQIERDPFARATLMRKTVPKDCRGECDWCGQPAKYQYFWVLDSALRPPKYVGRNQFCSKSCYKAYAS